MEPTSYPLTWPLGVPRRKPAERDPGARFSHRGARLTIALALSRLRDQLRLLGVPWDQVVVSTNVPTRLDGLPRSGVREDRDDPGASVWFPFEGAPRVFACDGWSRPADNIAAIAGYIDGIRKSERMRVGSMRQAFEGFKALPSGGESGDIYEALGAHPSMSTEEIRGKVSAALRRAGGPGSPGFDADAYAAIVDAWGKVRQARGL